MTKLPDNLKPVVCIAGPTASGKSAWAIELAQSVDGEIINADSMQVYEILHILSARPSQKEIATVPHHLFGFIHPSVRYSTGMWLRDVVPVILDCLTRGKTPILVGGTGLYFKALTEGLAAIPSPNQTGINKANSLLADGIQKLRNAAELVDPVAASRVLGDDPQRLTRIVSVAYGTDKILSDWQRNTRPIIPQGYWLGGVLLREREELYERINDRYVKMIENGGLEEAKNIQKLALDTDLPAMKAIGLPPLLRYLDGKLSYENAINEAKRDTRRFAKRQFTWFRGQTKHWYCVKNATDEAVFRQKISQMSI